MDKKSQNLFNHTILFICIGLLVSLFSCRPSGSHGNNTATPPTPAKGIAQTQPTEKVNLPTVLRTTTQLPTNTINARLTPEVVSPTITPASRVISPKNAGDVVRLATFGRGMVNGMPSYSLDGQLFVIPTSLGVDLYEASSLKQTSTLSMLNDGDATLVPSNPHLVTISSDRHLLAANINTWRFSPGGNLQADSFTQYIFYWNLADETVIGKILLSPEDSLESLVFSPNTQFLAVGFSSGNGRLIRIVDGEDVYSFFGSQVEFSPDGAMLVTMPSANGKEQFIRVYNTSNGKLLRQWEGQRATFAINGYLAVESNGAVRLIDVNKGIALTAFNGKFATFSNDGQEIALLDRGNLRVYQVTDGKLSHDLAGNFASIIKMQFAPDGKTLAALGEAPMCPNCLTAPLAVVWQLPDGTRTDIDIPYPLGLTYAPKEGYLVIWTNANINFIDPKTANTTLVFDEYAPGVDGIAFSPDRQILAANSGQPNLAVRLWRLSDDQLINIFADPNNPGYGYSKVVYSPNGKILWTQGYLWNTQTGDRLSHLVNILEQESPPYIPSSISFTSDGNTMAIGYLQGFLQLWDMRSEKLIRKLEGHEGEVVSLAFSQDGTTLAAVYAYPDFITQIWHIPDGEQLLTIKGTEWTHEFTKAVYTPDGQVLAIMAKSEDSMDLGIVELWRIADGQRILQLDTLGVLSIAISPDGKIIATGSYDHKVRLWETTGGILLRTLNGHGDYVTDLAFSPSGEILGSSSSDGTVILWGVKGKP